MACLPVPPPRPGSVVPKRTVPLPAPRVPATPPAPSQPPPRQQPHPEDNEDRRPRVAPHGATDYVKFAQEGDYSDGDQYQPYDHIDYLLALMAGAAGLEPTTGGFGDRCSTN